jgi:hypothetical protein
MPPKDSGMSKKTEAKKKEKVVDDLTFGLKNKNKSKVVQQYVKEVTNKVMFSQVKVSDDFAYGCSRWSNALGILLIGVGRSKSS